MNKRIEGSTAETCNQVRYLSIQLYFKKRLEGSKKREASEEAARFFWPNSSKQYRPRAILKWAMEFLKQDRLSNHSQGAHIKRESFLSDNDVTLKIVIMVQKTRPALRSLVYIKKFIDEEIIPSLLGVTGTISIVTLS
jgi:hypothetical protein